MSEGVEPLPLTTKQVEDAELITGKVSPAATMASPRRLTALKLCIICLAGFAVSVTINYPGFMSYDSVQQLLEARAGVYSDVHPPLIALMWHFTDKIIPGPFGMLLLETALIWCGTFLIAFYWFSDGHPAFALMPCIFVFYPPIFGISGVIWKDIFMWAFFMLAIGVAGAIKPGSAAVAGYRSIAKFVLGSLFLLLATLSRHNALLAVIPLIALGTVQTTLGAARSGRFFAGVSVIGGLLFAIILFGATLVNNALTSYKTTPWPRIALFDIGGIISGLSDPDEQKTIYERIPESLRGNGSLRNLLLAYNPADWTMLVQIENPAFQFEPFTSHKIYAKEVGVTVPDGNALTHVWLQTIFRHPLAWLNHRVVVSRILLGHTHHILWGSVFMIPNGFDHWVAEIYGRNPELNKFQNYVKSLLTQFSGYLFFRPWLYMTLSTFLILDCLIFPFAGCVQIALIALSGLTYEGGLFLFATSAEFRYSHYMIYTSVLASLLFLQTRFIKEVPRVRHSETPRCGRE